VSPFLRNMQIRIGACRLKCGGISCQRDNWGDSRAAASLFPTTASRRQLRMTLHRRERLLASLQKTPRLSFVEDQRPKARGRWIAARGLSMLGVSPSNRRDIISLVLRAQPVGVRSRRWPQRRARGPRRRPVTRRGDHSLRMLCVVQTNDHSPCTFSSPRNTNAESRAPA